MKTLNNHFISFVITFATLSTIKNALKAKFFYILEIPICKVDIKLKKQYIIFLL